MLTDNKIKQLIFEWVYMCKPQPLIITPAFNLDYDWALNALFLPLLPPTPPKVGSEFILDERGSTWRFTIIIFPPPRSDLRGRLHAGVICKLQREIMHMTIKQSINGRRLIIEPQVIFNPIFQGCQQKNWKWGNVLRISHKR